MSEFDSKAAEKPKKTYNDLTVEFFPFWKELFESIGVPNPDFRTKLCYMSGEFLSVAPADGKIPVVRFFKSELSAGKDLYIECCDWDYNFYEPMYRKLYKLKHDPNWDTNGDKFAQSTTNNTTAYAVKMSDLELVNETSITETKPKLRPPAAPEPTPVEEDTMREVYDDGLDDHVSKMTIRDEYCIRNGVPFSQKEWLNKLIIKGNQWLKENQK